MSRTKDTHGIDFDKAFNPIYHRAISKAPTSHGFEKPYVQTRSIIYKAAEARVQIFDDTAKEIRQEDPISPKLSHQHLKIYSSY